MMIFKTMNFDSISWSLRRWHVPVNKNDLVIEIGSGGNPYYRSNILCDADHRNEDHFQKLVTDRPLVLGYGENLPFQDNTFDFAIASYVFEHSTNPELFLKEIQRVAKRGFIEVPDGFRERFTNVPHHFLEISNINDVLHIRKKQGPINDIGINELLDDYKRDLINDFTARHPFEFQIRYYWDKDNGGIKYKILNPDYKIDWLEPEPDDKSQVFLGYISMVKKLILRITRKLFSQNKRNKKINLIDYVQCPNCKSSAFLEQHKKIECNQCSKVFSVYQNNIIDFIR